LLDVFAAANELTALLVHVHAKDNQHGKQSQSKKNGHFFLRVVRFYLTPMMLSLL